MGGPDSGVWHPDPWILATAWKGVGSSAVDIGFPSVFNPYGVTPAVLKTLVPAYTEVLTEASLQPYMTCTAFQDVEPTRGNLAITNQGVCALCWVEIACSHRYCHLLGRVGWAVI